MEKTDSETKKSDSKTEIPLSEMKVENIVIALV